MFRRSHAEFANVAPNSLDSSRNWAVLPTTSWPTSSHGQSRPKSAELEPDLADFADIGGRRSQARSDSRRATARPGRLAARDALAGCRRRPLGPIIPACAPWSHARPGPHGGPMAGRHPVAASTGSCWRGGSRARVPRVGGRAPALRPRATRRECVPLPGHLGGRPPGPRRHRHGWFAHWRGRRVAPHATNMPTSARRISTTPRGRDRRGGGQTTRRVRAPNGARARARSQAPATAS